MKKKLNSLVIKHWAPLLNQYIEAKIESGKFKKVKFKILINYGFIDPFQVKKESNNYFIWVDFLDLPDLLKLIDYFSYNGWMELPTKEMISKHKTGVPISNIRDAFLKERPNPDLSMFKSPITIWQTKDLRIVYENFTLKYYLNEKSINTFEIQEPLPINIRDRYILAVPGGFLVINSAANVLLEHKLDFFGTDIRKIEVSLKSVNYIFFNKIVSYSYKKNVFIETEITNNE